MAVDDTLVQEINAAIEVVVTPEPEAVAETAEAEPASETVVEHEDAVSEETPEVVIETKEVPASDPVVAKIATLSDFAIESAILAGLDLATARSFPSDEALLKIVEKVNSTRKAPEVVVPARQAVDPFADFDPSGYEPEVAKVITTLIAQSAVAEDIESWFDSKVEELGEDFHEVLGKGAYRKLPPNSAFMVKRDALADQVAILLSGYKATGRQTPSRDEVFSAAAKLVLAAEYEKAHESRLAGKIAKRSSQQINRAGGKGSKGEVNPQEAVAAMLDAKYFGKT
jgi:hypothetical protein